MSTVLWANLLVGAEVRTEQADRFALYKFGTKLEAMSKALGLTSFVGTWDHTDLRFNIEELELPPGATSTNDVMAKQGVWIETNEAVRLLKGLKDRIISENVRFGLLKNHSAELLEELTGVLTFISSQGSIPCKFNFCVVS